MIDAPSAMPSIIEGTSAAGAARARGAGRKSCPPAPNAATGSHRARSVRYSFQAKRPAIGEMVVACMVVMRGSRRRQRRMSLGKIFYVGTFAGGGYSRTSVAFLKDSADGANAVGGAAAGVPVM